MFVMGIAGGTGSGKTTFTTTLINRFKDDITVIHHDNYYNILDHLTFEERCLVNYDHPDSFDTKLMIEDIKKLKNGEMKILDIATPMFERTLINAALQQTRGRKRHAAELLGWGRNTLTRKLKELGMDSAEDDVEEEIES